MDDIQCGDRVRFLAGPDANQCGMVQRCDMPGWDHQGEWLIIGEQGLALVFVVLDSGQAKWALMDNVEHE